ncbi:MAG: NAD(P)/FAD-dependent oxidoreductase, partial [Syntrophales bacterium]|nr:NAD(P)/FAD-dependent oxidoreductase [Syntrophales bacterium]
MSVPHRDDLPAAVGKKRVIVVGAGAGGLMAAGRAAERGAEVLLLEKTRRPGQKILISGKSRCNLSNSKSLEDFLPMYGAQGVFLRQAFHRFFREELLALLARYGVQTKVERGGRIFPVSDDARDVVDALMAWGEDKGVILRTGVRVTAVRREGGMTVGVETSQGFLPADRVIMATGGATWPGT